MFSGHGLEIGRGGISPGQKLVESAVGVAVDDAGDDVGQVGVRLEANQLAGLDERSDHGPMFGTAVGAGEQGILSGQCKGTDAALDDVIVDLDAAVVEEQAQPLPARERVADRRGELGLLADELELGAQPGFESFDQRPAALLADRTPLLGGTATDLGLDPIERCNARQRLGGDRRRARLGQLVEVPAHVAPAEGKPRVALLGQYLVAAVAVDLQDALEAAEVRDRPLGLAVGRIDIGYTRWIGAAPWPVVPGIGEELAGLGPASSWIE